MDTPNRRFLQLSQDSALAGPQRDGPRWGRVKIPNMGIVVAGGTGFLGSALVDSWRAQGSRVLVLTRRPRRDGDVRWTPDGNDSSWTTTLDGADAVVNLAGEGIADKRWTAA